LRHVPQSKLGSASVADVTAPRADAADTSGAPWPPAYRLVVGRVPV
jgi:hypothetical protein